mmetsp:Transcript_10298/g.36297  ORF Transcript_10298/g.36297 Transcript_10298/m.36297 type:complete len:294 (-) Transcript_10298:1035-1916(-)
MCLAWSRANAKIVSEYAMTASSEASTASWSTSPPDREMESSVTRRACVTPRCDCSFWSTGRTEFWITPATLPSKVWKSLRLCACIESGVRSRSTENSSTKAVRISVAMRRPKAAESVRSWTSAQSSLATSSRTIVTATELSSMNAGFMAVVCNENSVMAVRSDPRRRGWATAPKKSFAKRTRPDAARTMTLRSVIAPRNDRRRATTGRARAAYTPGRGLTRPCRVAGSRTTDLRFSDRFEERSRRLLFHEEALAWREPSAPVKRIVAVSARRLRRARYPGIRRRISWASLLEK